jgi:hypothetical protein
LLAGVGRERPDLKGELADGLEFIIEHVTK